MACARPVASVPQGHIAKLIEPERSGFLLPNERDAWIQLLSRLPTRAELAAMGGNAARRVSDSSWRKTASHYLELAQRLMGESHQT
jgi:hypothetical protein